MASIHRQISVDVDADQAWAALRRVGEPHKLFAPVLVDGHLEGDTRTVTFANGMVVQERIVDVDEERRRVAYAVIPDGSGMVHHHASMEVVDSGRGRCLFVWTSDFLPHEIRSSMEPLIDQGTEALKNNLEACVMGALAGPARTAATGR